jgi:hypothetical protein
MLKEMGWPQPATPMQTDNSTACGIANDTIKQQQSRAIDMRFYWVQDRTQQGHFDIFWKPGSTNLADYFTKHHPAKHHQLMRPKYLYVKPTLKQPLLTLCWSCKGVLKPPPMPSRPAPRRSLQRYRTSSCKPMPHSSQRRDKSKQQSKQPSLV